MSFDDTWGAGRATNQDNLMNISLVDPRAAEDLFNMAENTSEEILEQLFEVGTSEGSAEVGTLEEGVNFDGGGCSGEEGPVGMFKGSMGTLEDTRVGGEILLILALEFLDEDTLFNRKTSGPPPRLKIRTLHSLTVISRL